MQKYSYVYIMTNKQDGTLYVGVTGDLWSRVWEHKCGVGAWFTMRYALHMLVYFEQYAQMTDAIARAKQLKAWTRKKKIELIVSYNPSWTDVAQERYGEGSLG